MDKISVCFTDDYDPIVEEINAISKELGISKSFIIRDIICEAFGFTPKKECRFHKKPIKND